MCHFNPVYGQGISVAAAEARLLRNLLPEGQEKLAQRFFGEAAKVIDAPWTITSGADLRFAEVEDKRSVNSRMMTSYLGKLFPVARTDQTAATAFLRVLNLLDPPDSLLTPELQQRVLG